MKNQPLTIFANWKLLVFLNALFAFHSAFSQPPPEYYETFNKGVMYWQMKPADYKNAFEKFARDYKEIYGEEYEQTFSAILD